MWSKNQTNLKLKKKNDSYSGYILFLYLKLLRKKNFFKDYIRNGFQEINSIYTKFAIQKFPNLTVKELDNKIKKISNKMGLTEKFKVTEKFPGSFLIEKEK